MKIVCAIDGSEFASWGVEALGVLFHNSVKEIVLLHVFDASQLKKGLKEDRTNKVETKKALAAMDSEARKVLNVFSRAGDACDEPIRDETVHDDTLCVCPWPCALWLIQLSGRQKSENLMCW